MVSSTTCAYIVLGPSVVLLAGGEENIKLGQQQNDIGERERESVQ